MTDRAQTRRVTVARSLPLTLLMVILAASHAPSAVGQNNETCIAYMEADAAYERSKYLLFESPEYKAATARYFKLQRKPLRLNGKDLLDPDKWAAYQAARKKERQAFEVIQKAKAVAMNPAQLQREAAYHAAYRGPTSKVASVMKKLIAADRERCRQRLER